MAPNAETKAIRLRILLSNDCDALMTFLTENDPLTDLRYQELLSRKDALEKLFHKVCDARELLDPTSQAFSEASDVFGKYHETISKVLVAINQYTSRSNVSSAPSIDSNYSQAGNINFKLPEIKLPIFEGDVISWQNFKDSFESLIINTSLPNSTKYHYLNGCLKGDAKALLLNLATTGDNFSVAWDLLKRRFDSPRGLVTRHLSLLLSPPALSHGSASSLQKLIDFYRLHTNALRAVRPEANLADLLLIGLVTKELPHDIIKQWEITLKPNELPDFDALLDYLEVHQRSLQAVAHPANQPFKQASKDKSNSFQVSGSSSQWSVKCPKCKSEHFLQDCPSFLGLKPKDRYEFISKSGRCSRCFNVKTATHSCTIKCAICQRPHNKLLHFEERSLAQGSHSNVTITSSNHAAKSSNLIPTAQVNCVAASGKLRNFTVLLDTGSGANLVTWTAVKALRLRVVKAPVTISGVASGVMTSTHSTTVKIKSCNTLKPWCTTVDCAIVDKIPKALERNLNPSSWELPEELFYADPDFECSKDIDLLLGSGFFFEILLPGKLTRTDGPYPVVQETELGWIVGGKIPCSQPPSLPCNFILSNFNLPEQLRSFWEVEEVSPIKPILHEEEIAESHFLSTFSRDSSGRYVVRLPTNSKLNLLGDSKAQSLKRLHALERRFERDPILKYSYQEFIEEYLRLGHMQPAPAGTSENAYFVPHHPIMKPSSDTTPLRVVFDFSAKTTSGMSLNDALINGAKIQDDLFDILVKFRLHKVAIVADLEKMFRQVQVHSADWHLQHILWRSSPALPVQDFVLNTVTYGSKPATFLAVRALHQLADDEGFDFPLASSVLRNAFYVDDLLHSSPGTSSSRETISQLNQLLAKGGFTLRKWASNDKHVLSDLPPSSLAKSNIKTFASKELNGISTLGVTWDTESDLLSLSLPKGLNFKNSRFTKRSMLSVISSIFDPLGLLAPCTIVCKLLFQEIWKFELSWDDPLPSTIALKWQEVFASLADVPSLKFPRCVLPSESPAVSLHGFCDSSLLAYGAVVYICHINEQGVRVVTLLCAKSKVVPSHLKDKNNSALTVPRLELCAAVLLSKLVNKIITILSNKVNFKDINCWSDSRIVLDWLCSPPLKGNIFAKNRAQYIREICDNFIWRYINTHVNPADALSRGMTPIELKSKKDWWTGPPFLTQDSCNWPNTFVLKFDKPSKVLHFKMQSISYLNERVCCYYSSFQRMIRVMAYILRFIRFLKESVISKRESRCSSLYKESLTVSELLSSELQCVKIVQQVAFPLAWKALSNKMDCPTEGGLIPLNPFLHSDGCIRVGGRISESSLPEDSLHPLILPRCHHLTSALIFDAHKKLLHANVQSLAVFIRQRFWIISLRRAIKSVIRTCYICFRHSPKPAQQLMGDLPAVRVQPNATFRSVGVDYTGYFWVKFGVRGKSRAKVYLALFICMVTKAVHIEIVSSLTTHAFLMVLKRFVSRRGLPDTIYSDNATTFVGTHRKLDALFNLINSSAFQNEITEFCSTSHIKWRFIPPRSPHVGGIWEAGIKILKKHLQKELGEAVLTYEELLTVSVQIECILNSRPLIRPSDDSSEFDYLTPGHFLIGRPINMLPSVTNLPSVETPRWDLHQKEMSLIWNRWSKEYLQTLQRRAKWNTSHPDIQVGTPVLVMDDNLPPLTWKLGVINTLFRGRDNRVRTVTVRTSNGIITRHINKLCPFPLERGNSSA